MQKIDDITNTADNHGEFTNGNVAADVAPTLLEAPWFNTVQREIINVLLKAGMKPDKTNDAQLSEAIGQLVANSKVALTDSLGQSSTLAASQKLVNTVNDNANSRLEKAKNGADIPNKAAFVNNIGLGNVLKVGDYGLGVADGATELLKSIYDIKCTRLYRASGRATPSPTEGMPENSGNTLFSVLALNIYAGQYWVTLTSTNQFYVGMVDTENKTVSWVQHYSTAFKPSAANLGLGDAALRNIGAGQGQIPDMSFFQYKKEDSGYQKLPSGIVIQWGRVTTGADGDWVNLPIHFPERCIMVIGSEQSNAKNPTVVTFSDTGRTSFFARGWNLIRNNSIAINFG